MEPRLFTCTPQSIGPLSLELWRLGLCIVADDDRMHTYWRLL